MTEAHLLEDEDLTFLVERSNKLLHLDLELLQSVIEFFEMKSKFRIVEKQDVSNEVIYVPQYKKYFMWWNFMQMEIFPKIITFYSFDSAKKFIHTQMSKPDEKYHYF